MIKWDLCHHSGNWSTSRKERTNLLKLLIVGSNETLFVLFLEFWKFVLEKSRCTSENSVLLFVDSEGNTLLHHLTKGKCFQCLQELLTMKSQWSLQQKIDNQLGKQNDDGNTFLHVAALEGILKDLMGPLTEVEMGKNDPWEVYYLHGRGVALKKNSPKTQRREKEEGENFLSTALNLGLEENVADFVLRCLGEPQSQLGNQKNSKHDGKRIIDDLCKAHGLNKNTLLHLAVRNKSQMDVQALAEQPVKEWELNQDGFSALHLAVLNNDADMVKLILDSFTGIGVNCRTAEKETSLHLAAKMGLTDMIERLVKLGADLSKQDKDGHTLLHDCLQQVHLEGGSTHPDRCQKFKDVWRCVVGLAAEWSSKKRGKPVPMENTQKYFQVRRNAVFELRSELPNQNGLSVLQYAADLGLEECVLVMLTEKGVFVVNDDPNNDEAEYKIEVTNLTPELLVQRNVEEITKGNTEGISSEGTTEGDSGEASSRSGDKGHRTTLMETLVQIKPSMKASQILDNIPLKRLLQWQWKVYQWFSILWLAVHTIIMLFFSINAQGVFITEKESTTLAVKKSTRYFDRLLLGYSSTLCLLVFTSMLWTFCALGFSKNPKQWRGEQLQEMWEKSKEKTKLKDKPKKLYKGDKGVFGYLTRIVNGLVSNIGLLLRIAFFIFCLLANIVSSNQQYVVVKGFSLLFGWLIILVPARIYGPTFHVISTLKLLVINDMIPFLFFYLIITLAFACAVQVQFQLFHLGSFSPNTHDLIHHLQTLGTVFFELLVVTVGLDTDLKHIQGVTDSFGESPLNVTVMQVLLTTYCVLSALILLNMLIAMMGTTMDRVTQDEGLIWKQHQVRSVGSSCGPCCTL